MDPWSNSCIGPGVDQISWVGLETELAGFLLALAYWERPLGMASFCKHCAPDLLSLITPHHLQGLDYSGSSLTLLRLITVNYKTIQLIVITASLNQSNKHLVHRLLTPSSAVLSIQPLWFLWASSELDVVYCGKPEWCAGGTEMGCIYLKHTKPASIDPSTCFCASQKFQLVLIVL